MILAAGRGRRMGTLTLERPKPLIEIDGVPLIEHRVRQLREAGFSELVINLAYRGDQIRRHLGDGKRHGVHIEYSQEPPGALETGGGIAAALDLLGQAPFVVVNSDIWTDFDFSTLGAPRAAAHLVLVPNPSHNLAGDFKLRNDRIVMDGGQLATFSGIGVYQPTLFKGQTVVRFPLAPLLREQALTGALTGELYDGMWFDIGTEERLNTVCTYVASQHK